MNFLDRRTRMAAVAGAGALFGLVMLATPAAAQSSAGEMACQNDAFRLCDRYIPDRGKVAACLRRNMLRLSPDCRRMFGGRKSLRRR